MEHKRTCRGGLRHKISIAKIESKVARQVCFSKRKQGLFKKAAELCVLTGAQLALIAFSPAGKPFTFAYPSVEEVAKRSSLLRQRYHNNNDNYFSGGAVEQQGMSMEWWDVPIDGLDVYELETMKERLEEFKREITAATTMGG